MAASCALGGVSVGSLNDFLPFLLKEISSQPRRQYLLLNSLKEVIRWGYWGHWQHHGDLHHAADGPDSRSSLSACPGSSLSPYVDSIWALLLQNCECQEEGTRNLVAECLGKLTLANAARLLPKLRQQLEAGRRPEDSLVPPHVHANGEFCSSLPQLLLWLAAQW